MKQTAVEWLVEKFNQCEPMYSGIQSLEHKQYLDGLIEKAKAMEEKNLKDSFVAGAGIGEMFNNENRCYVTDAEKYLRETFKSE